MKILAMTVLGLLVSGSLLNAAESSYTKIDLGKCDVIMQDRESGGIAWMCKGHNDLPLYVAEGDLRFFVSYGANYKDKMATGQTLPPFNSINTVLEWRLDEGGQPYATILRYFTDTGSGAEQKKGEVLVVTKVSEDQACHMALVDAIANTNANVLARQAADTMAQAFVCGTHEALVVGKSGVSPMGFN